MTPNETATKIAREVHATLGPHCEKFTFAGSLRRRAAMVKDVEAVVLPKLTEVPDGLFGTKMIRSQEFVLTVVSLGEIVKGDPSDGRYVQIAIGGKRDMENKVVGGFQFDLFIPQPSDYGRILAIRTGPSQYSARVVASKWVAMGWCGTAEGLRRQSQCEQNGKLWKLRAGLRNVVLPPEFNDEKDFWAFLELPYVEPVNRI